MRRTTFAVRIATGIDGTPIEDEKIWIDMPHSFRGTYLMGDSRDARIFNRLVAQKAMKRLARLQRGENWTRKWG